MNKLHLSDRIIVIEAEPSITIILQQLFTFKDTSQCMRNGIYDKTKIKNVTLLKKNKKQYYLFSGFLRQLITYIKQYNWKFSIGEDKRTKILIPENPIFNSPNISLRDYQKEAIKKMLYDKIGILKLSTSAGKTLIAGMILKILNIPFLFIADKKGLIQQAWEEFTKIGLDCGICHSEKKIFKQSMCCTIGSISKINNLNEIKVLIFDECHHGGANQFQTFFSSFLPPIRIGLSATPEGNDPFKFALLKQFFGEIVYTVGVNELITEGFVAEPTIFFIRNKVKPEIDWNITEIKQVIENKNRNNIIKKIVNNNSDKHILILVNKQQHGEILNKLIDNSIYIDGRDSIKLRNEVKENIENGTQKIVIASGIFNEGISINSIEIIINASARKGRVEQIQKIGRGLRIKQGKTKVVMIDFEDNGNKILYKQHLTRKNEWKKEGFKNFKIVNESDIEDLDFTSFLD